MVKVYDSTKFAGGNKNESNVGCYVGHGAIRLECV